MAGLMDLRRQILLNTPHLETASGSIATFQTDMKAPLKQLIVGVSPEQDLNGYDHPWPPGGSKNLYDPDAVTDGYYINASGAIRSHSESCYSGLIPVVAGETYVYSGTQAHSGNNNKRFHAYADGVWQEQILVQSVPQGAFAVAVTIPDGCNGLRISAYKDDTNRMVELGSTATSYVPYSNICPISGWTGANIHVSPTLDAQDGTTYAYSWQTEAGTVYGDTVDPISGTLTVTHEKTHYGASDNWNTTSRDVVFRITNPSRFRVSSVPLCSAFIGRTPTYAAVLQLGRISYNTTLDTLIVNAGDKYDTLDKFKALLTNIGGFDIVRQLVTPQTYQLTPTQIQTLVGANNIWADSGDVSVKFWTHI